MNFEKTKSFSRQLDKQDAIKGCRELFHYPKDGQGKELIYFCGNSLGLQPKKVSSYIEKELSIWAEKGVLGQDERWISYHEKLQGTTSRLVGALESEVVVMNALTVNIHLLLVSFYQPIEGKKQNKSNCCRYLMPLGGWMHVNLSINVYHTTTLL
mgnify:CR=1 FL=1